MTELLNDAELEKKLEDRPAPRVTKEQIESRIAGTTYHRITETVIICNIQLDNGYSVIGKSACVNAENFDQQIGERISFDNAFRELWPLFGFLLAENNYRGFASVPTAA